jgi:hypothetical protein
MEDQWFLEVDGPDRLPFQIKVGPIASGNAVVKDGTSWDRLKELGVRSVLGIEMEAASLARIAFDLRVPSWIVVKGVMDHGDPRKDDRFKPFAARVSAEVLFEFLTRQLSPRASGLRPMKTLTRSVYVIGGISDDRTFDQLPDEDLWFSTCRQLGETVANSGAELIVCSPLRDAADYHIVKGYVGAGRGGRVHFHTPKNPFIAEQRTKLDQELGASNTRFSNYFYPGPENPDDPEERRQAWLLCQLSALEYADVVFAIGGRVPGSASTLLHIAEARRIPVVPFAFLGGAAERLFRRSRWKELVSEFDSTLLEKPEGIASAMKVADQFLTARIRSVRHPLIEPVTFFISRSHFDHEFSDALVNYLLYKGRRPLIGDREIQDDRMPQPAIEDALLQADVCIVLWSRNYALSRWCADELDLALEMERASPMSLWLFNIDGSDIVSRAARRIPQAVVRTPGELNETVGALLDFRS